MMKQPKDQVENYICPECGKSTLYLADSFFFQCLNEDCNEQVPVEYFIEEEPEFYDQFGDKIVY